MSSEKYFVGRKDILLQFDEFLKCSKGQAALVVGQQGMGKTMLLEQMMKRAIENPELECACIRHEVVETDSVDATMDEILDQAYYEAEIGPPPPDRQTEQLRVLLNVIKIGDLVMSLKRDPPLNARDQFLKRLGRISAKMPKNGRTLFIIDPNKYMQLKSDQAWAAVLQKLPDKIKIVFAQRPEDVLASSDQLCGCSNVIRLPQHENGLDALDDCAVTELVRLRARDIGKSEDDLMELVAGYNGHPYAIDDALNLIQYEESTGRVLDDPRPTGVANAQWDRILSEGDDAQRLFIAYAILEVPVPDEIALAVSEIHPTALRSLLAKDYLKGLFREEKGCRRIYHTLLADHILEALFGDEKRDYNRRAAAVYQNHLTSNELTEHQSLSAIRLPEHVLAADGEEAFLEILNTVDPYLDRLGLWERRRSFLMKGIEKTDDRGKIARFLFEIGKAFSYQNRYKEALENLCKSESAYAEANDQEGRARANVLQAEIFRKQNNSKKAQKCLYNALELLQKSEKETAQLVRARCNAILAVILFDIGHLAAARNALDSAEKILADFKPPDPDREIMREQASVLHHIGNVLFSYDQLYWGSDPSRLKLEKTEEFLKAGEKYNEAIEKLEQIENPEVDEKRSLAFYHDHRSQWFFREGDLEKARSESERAMSLFAEVSQRDGEGYAKDHLGEVHLALGYRAFCKSKRGVEVIKNKNLENAENEYENARKCFQTALVIFEDLDKKDARAWLLHHFGEAEENLGDVRFDKNDRAGANKLWNEALKKYDRAMGLFKSLDNWKEVLHIRAHIADVNWKIENGNITPAVEEYRSIIASFFHKDFYKDLYR